MAASQNDTTITKDSLFQGRVPKMLFFVQLSNAAFSGDYTKNPYNFRHYQTSSAILYLGSKMIPTAPWQLDPDNDLYMKAYLSLMTTLNCVGNNIGPSTITRDAWKNGAAVCFSFPAHFSFLYFSKNLDLCIRFESRCSGECWIPEPQP